MDTFITNIGHLVFHFTNFESGIKILATKSLLFGEFENMNDIAETGREILSNISPQIAQEELSRYKSISLTLDKPEQRGFSIDPLWGHYADKGNGICLVFDKLNLEKDKNKQFGLWPKIKPIKYLPNFSNAVFTEGLSQQEVEKEIEESVDDIFFTKSKDWEYEQELRILIKGDIGRKYKLSFSEETIVASILCLPKIDNYKETPEFSILKSILKDKPLLHYTTSLGNKELLDENSEKTCNAIGKDLQIDDNYK